MTQGMWKQVVARDEGSRHLWKALMRRYCLERHCRLRKFFLGGNNHVTSPEHTRHCYTLIFQHSEIVPLLSM